MKQPIHTLLLNHKSSIVLDYTPGMHQIYKTKEKDFDDILKARTNMLFSNPEHIIQTNEELKEFTEKSRKNLQTWLSSLKEDVIPITSVIKDLKSAEQLKDTVDSPLNQEYLQILSECMNLHQVISDRIEENDSFLFQFFTAETFEFFKTNASDFLFEMEMNSEMNQRLKYLRADRSIDMEKIKSYGLFKNIYKLEEKKAVYYFTLDKFIDHGEGSSSVNMI
jgi:hypothetical protein